RRHTRSKRDWSSDVCSSDLVKGEILLYDLPEDLFQLLGGLIRLSPEGLVRYHGHQLLGGRRVAIPRRDQGTYYAEYFRYPHLPRSEERRVGKEYRARRETAA